MSPSHSQTFNFPIQLPIPYSIKSRILAFEDPIPAVLWSLFMCQNPAYPSPHQSADDSSLFLQFTRTLPTVPYCTELCI